MTKILLVRPLVVFVLAFSLSSLPGPLTSHFYLPSITVGRADVAPSNQPWYPSGAAMNTELINIFQDQSTEYKGLTGTGAPPIDLTDFPLTPFEISCLGSGGSNCLTTPSSYYVTSPVTQSGYFELEFNLANTFWGCGFNFGNSVCGTDIRQGIAHLIDKNVFTQNEPAIASGQSTPIDNPVPPTDGLITPNACGWDSLFPEPPTPGICQVSASTPGTGGTAYHLGSSTLGNWLQDQGTQDFCAAAQHFINAGLATGKDSNCVLTGISTSVTSNPATIDVRNDNPALKDLGEAIATGICHLFGMTLMLSNGYGGCSINLFLGSTILHIVEGTIGAFEGFNTSGSSPNLQWWIYTAGPIPAFPFDRSLYSSYDSLFVSDSGLSKSPCASKTVTNSAPNYVYLCNSTFDIWTSAMESAICTSTSGDPVPGSSTNNVAGTCPGASGTCPSVPTSCSAVSAGFMAENIFGQGAYTIPVWSGTGRFAYLSNWTTGIVNDAGSSIPNFFAWLNAWTSNPSITGLIRQGFSESPRSLSPYAASSPWDFYVLGNIYDSLYAQNPLNHFQVIDWMTKSHSFVSNSGLSYTPPSGTTVTIHNELRSDIFWHDGSKVSAFDVAFSYLSLAARGAFQAGSLIGTLSGATVLSPTAFDLNLKFLGPFTELSIGGLTIIPGHIWYSPATGCPSSWGALTSTATPAIYPSVSSTCLNTSATMADPFFDPLSSTTVVGTTTYGDFIGSGPWVCETQTLVGGGCSSSGSQFPGIGGTYILTRYGCTITSTGDSCASPATAYFRSNGSIALWIWSEMTGSISGDFLTASQVSGCYGKPVGTSGCTHWQQGIGNPTGDGVNCCVVGINQVGVESRFFLVNWVAPYIWTSLTGIIGFPPVLYEGTTTLSPASVKGCKSTFATGGGYDC